MPAGRSSRATWHVASPFYRCKVSTDYPVVPAGHPASLAVREDRLLPHVDAWLSSMFAPESLGETARQVVEADAASSREVPSIARARATVMDCERKLSRYLDGLEAGIPADVVADRIATAQREKAEAEALLAKAPPAPEPLSFDEVLQTLSEFHDLPHLLGTIEKADRAALYSALGLTLTYRRVGKVEEVKLRATFPSVDLERVGGATRTFTTRGYCGAPQCLYERSQQLSVILVAASQDAADVIQCLTRRLSSRTGPSN